MPEPTTYYLYVKYTGSETLLDIHIHTATSSEALGTFQVEVLRSNAILFVQITQDCTRLVI